MREVLKIPKNHKVIVLQGGATTQFASVPLTLLKTAGAQGDYLVTGQWGDKAAIECNKYGKASVAANTKSTKYTQIPPESEWKLSAESLYLHYTDNETVN